MGVSSIQDEGLSTVGQSRLCSNLVLYTTMTMKQYHFKHFYANFDFDQFPWNFMKKNFWKKAREKKSG